MNRNEKLLEAIGQIDDSLILDAMETGNAGKGKVVSIQEGSKRVQGKKKNSGKRAVVLRFQGALAACAVLAVCLGIYGLLAAKGLMINPFEKNADTQMAVERTADMARIVPEEAAKMEAAAPAAQEAAVSEAAVSEAAASETSLTAAAFDAPKEQAGAEKMPEVVIVETETAEVESSATEPAETEIDIEGEDPEVEAIVAEMELALLQEPMVMSLRPAAEEISGTELAGEPAEKEISLLMKASLVETTGTDVTLTYSNNYETAIVTYGSMYSLELEDGDGWTEVPTLENIGWNAMLYILEPGKTSKETYLLSVIYGDLQAGHYRLVKNCTVEHEDQEAEEIVIHTEFDIVK